MSLTQLTNLQAELVIINQSLALWDEMNVKPSTYNELVNRKNQILQTK